MMIEFLPLHEHKEHLDACAEILNDEWPRSRTARLHMLEKSNHELPFCIVMVTYGADRAEVEVTGHSRLSKVQGNPQACFVESVIVKRSKRGKGYGRKVMTGTESIAKQLGYNTIYLTTHDKQDFYQHIGYESCEPIISLGAASSLLTNDQMEKLFGKLQVGTNLERCHNEKVERLLPVKPQVKPSDPLLNSRDPKVAPPPCHGGSTLPPPPPPPSMAPSKSLQALRMDPSKVHWMKKTL